MRSVTRLLVLAPVAAVLLVLGSVGLVLAQGSDLNGKLLTGSNVTVDAGQTVDHDLYAFAGNVAVNGTVNGDLTATGGSVTVNGTVTGDVIAAGGTITVNGQVGGNVRAAGGTIRLAGQVGKDVAVAGGTLDVGGKVGGDVIAGGGDLTISGTVAGSTAGSVAQYTKSGVVTGTDAITVSAPTGPPAETESIALGALRQYVAVLLFGLIAIWLAPRALRAMDAEVRDRPLPAVGYGLLGIVGYIGSLIVITIGGFVLAAAFAALGFGALAAIDIIGILVGIAGLTLAFFVVVGFLADVVVGLALARLLVGVAGSRGGAPAPAAASATAGPRSWPGDRWSDLLPLLIGAAIVVVLTTLPIVGPWLKLLVVLLGLGGIVWWLWRRPTGRVAPDVAGPPASVG